MCEHGETVLQMENKEYIHYIDIMLMYPFKMSNLMHDYQIGEPIMYVNGHGMMLDPSLNFDNISIFGVIKCCIQPPKDFAFSILILMEKSSFV